MNLPKIDSSNLWDKIYLILKERIVQRRFKPNEKLSIPELAAQLGVSRTPVRDALNRLEMDGLVKTVSKVGTFVTAIDIDDVLDIMDTRLMLELWTLEKLYALPKDDLRIRVTDLEDILDDATRFLENESLKSFLQANFNLQFHIEFIKLAGNKRIVDIYTGLMNYHFLGVELSLFTKDMVSCAINQHHAVVTALKSGNLEEGRTAIKVHLQDAQTQLINRLRASGGHI